jgi:hypothetical protein
MRHSDFSVEISHCGIVSENIVESFVIDFQSLNEGELEDILKVGC